MAKGPEAFRTISEAAEEVGVAQHVLRFWESRFSFLRPMKRAGGRRFYRPQDITQLKALRSLLHDQGMTIKGVQQLHRQKGMKALLVAEQDGVASVAAPAPVSDDAAYARVAAALREALAAKANLDALLEEGA